MTKIAIIGCGKQSTKHIEGLRKADPALEIVVADIREDAAKAVGESHKLAWTTDIEGLLADPSITAVDICTPTPTHAALIEKTLLNDKDFFCEKPLCETLEEAEKLLKLTNKKNRIGMVGYIYRFVPVFEKGRDLLEKKTLGDVVSAQFRIGGRGSHQLWKHKKNTGGGAINEMLVHMLDLAVWYFGDVKKAEVLINELRRSQRVIGGKTHEVDAEDYVVVRCQMASGTDVLIQADLITPAFSQLVEIQGDNGTFMGSIQPDMPSFVFLQSPANDIAGGRTELKAQDPDLFGAQMSEFVTAIKTRKAPSRCTLEDSVKVMRAMHMIKENAA